MRIDRREPQGDDEQREFQEILEQFKRGIDENLDTDDYEAHYDLGVAFKEMGLLDEAIAEFQKALRAPDGRLRTPKRSASRSTTSGSSRYPRRCSGAPWTGSRVATRPKSG
jgi:tetratricopeptide (TPR) repeat protein